MADADINDQDLLDYDEEEQPQQKEAEKKNEKNVKGSYVSIHSSGFRDFLLKPELSKAIVDCGFEHPSQVIKSIHVMVFRRSLGKKGSFRRFY